MVIKKNYKKNWLGSSIFQLSQEKALEVRGDLIAMETEEKAS